MDICFDFEHRTRHNFTGLSNSWVNNDGPKSSGRQDGALEVDGLLARPSQVTLKVFDHEKESLSEDGQSTAQGLKDRSLAQKPGNQKCST